MGELADYLIEHDPNFRKARLPALYSDFRPQRTLNPDGYIANVSAWRSALTLLTTTPLLPSPLILSILPTLPRALEHKQYGQPIALGVAIREAVAAGDLVNLADFNAPPSMGWRLARWTLGRVWASEGLPLGRFVVVANLEKAAKGLVKSMEGRTSIFDRVFTKTQFHSTFAAELLPGQQLSGEDLDILLQFLSRDKRMIEYDGQTIRVKGSGENRKITEQDTTIASIKELSANLSRQIHLLETKIEELSLSAKSAISRKNRISALACLKSKKLAEASLSSRYATLTQLDQISSKIEQAADQVALVEVMESSSGVLEGLNRATGGVERVDNVMDKLQEQMGETDEVAAILAEGASVDEGEIDEELEAMMEQERKKEEAVKRAVEQAKRDAEEEEARRLLERLPVVPSGPVADKEVERPWTPTSATGIGGLSMKDTPEKERELSS